MMLSAAELEILRTSLDIALRAVIWSLPFAVAVAFALSRPRLPGKLALDGLAHMPVILPPVLVGFLLLLLLGRRGPLGAWLEQQFGIHLAFTANGAALATAVMIFPVFVRIVRLALKRPMPACSKPRRSWGQGRWTVFFRWRCHWHGRAFWRAW